MPLKKLQLKPGVNRENTRYTNEGGWYDSDKVRFRQGTPEKIGGWVRISDYSFLGICRSLWSWVTLGGQKLTGVGTNLKFYTEQGGVYSDITPNDTYIALTDPFETTAGSSIVEVTDATSSYSDSDFVSFYNATAVGGITVYGTYQLTTSSNTTYTIDVGTAATSSATGGGTVDTLYQINAGPSYVVPLVGWGAGGWGLNDWGVGDASSDSMRVWSQNNFGEDLIFGPRGGGIYYWDASIGSAPLVFTASVANPTVITIAAAIPDGTPVRFAPDEGATMPAGITAGKQYYVRNATSSTFNISETPTGTLVEVTALGVGQCRLLANAFLLSDFGGSAEVPTRQNFMLVSDISRFVFAFGANEYSSATFDPMLIRWSDQEDPFNWAPSSVNQAGFLRLSHGSEIVTAVQARQEVLVWTDSALYALQYVGAPVVWGAQLLGDNSSIASQNAVAYANGVAYWMGKDKFYKYDGTMQTLRCDLRQFIFTQINHLQIGQVFAGTNEAYNEVWWFYCNGESNDINRYVVYNYAEDIWYYGTMARTAWLDVGTRDYPIAATYINNLVEHENGVDNNETPVTEPIASYITSSEFDLDDGHNFMFVWRVLPDVTFRGSGPDNPNPSIDMTLYPLKNAGSGYTDPASVAGQNYAGISRSSTVPIEKFTGQIFTRVRGRQMAIKISSEDTGVAWQLGAPRLDMRPDGRR